MNYTKDSAAKFLWAAAAVALLGPSHASAADDCTPISAATAERLATYVHDKFGFPPSIAIELSAVETIQGTCFRKVHFRSKGGGGPADIPLFLSADQRFLSHDLMNLDLDPHEDRFVQQQAVQAELDDGDFPTRGLPSAPVTLTIFSDFECPFCRQQVRLMQEKGLPPEARLVYRNFPLPGHPWARAAAEMAACAYRQSPGAFWDLHDALFAAQEKVTKDSLERFVKGILGRRADIDLRLYGTCVAEHQVSRQIDQDISFAMGHGVQGTPTLFVNGVRHDGVATMEEIRKLVGDALKNKSAHVR